MSDTETARALLEIGAVGFTPDQPITFKSGMLAPVYVDNRKLIFWPKHWRTIIESFRRLIEAEQIAFDVVAGIETAGIPHSSVLAYIMEKPSVFVRKQAKEHGTKSRVEGGDVKDKRVLLIEDLVTTGSSSLAGVVALRDSGAVVENCLAITSYGFAMAEQAFKVADVQLRTLTSFRMIAQEALKAGHFGAAEMVMIEDWLNDPHGWTERHGLERD